MVSPRAYQHSPDKQQHKCKAECPCAHRNFKRSFTLKCALLLFQGTYHYLDMGTAKLHIQRPGGFCQEALSSTHTAVSHATIRLGCKNTRMPQAGHNPFAICNKSGTAACGPLHRCRLQSPERVDPLGRQHEVSGLADGDGQVAQPPLAAEAVRARVHRVAGAPTAYFMFRFKSRFKNIEIWSPGKLILR